MAADSEDVTLRLLGDNSSLNKAIQDSQGKVKAFGADLESGSKNLRNTFTQATTSLSELDVELAKTNTLTDQQAAEIKGLSREYALYATQAGEAAGVVEQGSFRQINSLGSLASALGKSAQGAAALAGEAIAVGEAFSFGYSEGTKLRNFLNDLSDGAFDGLIKRLPQMEIALAVLSPTMETDADSAQQLANQLNILRNNGIDPTGLSAEQVQQKVDELGISMRDLSAASAQATRDIEQSIEKRRAAAEALVAAAEGEERSGKLTGAVLAETKDRVKDLLDQYDRLGEQAPANLQALADKLGVVTDAQKRAAEEAKRLAEEQERAATRVAEAKLREAEREIEASLRSAERQVEDSKRIAESVRGETKDLEARTEAVVSWAQEVASSGSASREEIAQVRKVVQDQLDTYSRLGKEAPADLQAVAKEWHVTTSDVEKDAEKAKKALESVEKGFASLVDRLNKGTNAKNPADELAAALAEREQLNNKSTQSQEDLDKITELDQKISDLRFSVKDEGDTWFNTNKRIELSTKDVRQAVLDLFSSSRDSLRDLSQDQRDEIQRTLQNLLTLGDSGKASASDLDSALRGVRDVLQGAGVDTSDLDISLEKAGGQAFDLNRAFDDLGKKDVKETIGGVAALGDESEKSAEKQKAISDQIAAWRKELEQIKKDDALGTAGKSAEQLRDRLKEVTEIAKELRKALSGTDTGAGGEGGDTVP